LIEVARRLTLTLRTDDTVARLGGDEFVLLVGDLSADEASAARQVYQAKANGRDQARVYAAPVAEVAPPIPHQSR